MDDAALPHYEGALLGLALGDAMGAPFEGGPLERGVWRLVGRTRDGEARWTDDTQMAIDVAESLLALQLLDPEDLAQRFASSYSWSRGYGRATARTLKAIRRGTDWRRARVLTYEEGSCGNGGAMRAPVLALWFAHRSGSVADAARTCAEVTHAHPLAIEGAVLVAVATEAALAQAAPSDILSVAAEHSTSGVYRGRLQVATDWIASASAPTAGEVRGALGNGVLASESCVTAIYLACRFLRTSFEEMVSFARACRGDVDTISAMAGAMWGAARGAAELPPRRLAALEQVDRLRTLARRLHPG